ncbi:reverse transcriptase domain-containing protein [Tanacetum coccineum]
MSKYGVTHRLATAYHPQTSRQVEVSNRGLKRILERTVRENHASWSDRLDDALWAFRTAFKTPIRCTPYKLVYGKSCHLPIKLEHKAYWALKHANFDLKTVGDHRKLQLNELNELRDQAYENSLIYKERTKKLHDSKIKNRIFNVGDRVLLFNSRLKIFSGKLKTRWSGPFTITQVFPYGTIELSQPDGPNFKVNGHRVKHYFGGDIPSKIRILQKSQEKSQKPGKTSTRRKEYTRAESSPLCSRVIEILLYDNSSPRLPEDLTIESFSPSPIPVEDSDSFMEEIDIFLASDDSTPPGVESDYDSEGDILFLEELLNDDLVPLSKYNHFTFDVEPDTTVKNDFDELNEDPLTPPLLFRPAGTDIANITRKEPKPDKNEHGNGKSTQETGRSTQLQRSGIATLAIRVLTFSSKGYESKCND